MYALTIRLLKLDGPAGVILYTAAFVSVYGHEAVTKVLSAFWRRQDNVYGAVIMSKRRHLAEFTRFN